MSKFTTIETVLLTAVITGFTATLSKLNALETTDATKDAQIADLQSQLAASGHTVADVQAKFADLQANSPDPLTPDLDAAITKLLGTEDPTGSAQSATPPPAAQPDPNAGAPAGGTPTPAPADSAASAAPGGDGSGGATPAPAS